ncbi:hypothetical protein GF360_03435 [candidate division WWE3 bacterium]|nr:hypothetical protein [candidate division WWE3 bacterium]
MFKKATSKIPPKKNLEKSTKIKKSELTKSISITLLITTILISLILRLVIFQEEGGDHLIYKKAVLDFCAGENPYTYTYKSFTNKQANLDRGYAYFPTLLYILTFMWKINTITATEMPTAILWKIPVLLADMGIAALLYNYFAKRKKHLLATLATSIWLLNPHFLTRYEYTLLDPIQVLFTFLALKSLSKNSYKTGILYALAVSTKLIPAILFPIFFIKTKNKVKFLMVFGLVFLLISLPFLTSRSNIFYYIQGTFLVHGERFIQGRPFLSFLTLFTQKAGLSFYQEKFTSLFSKIALLSGPMLTTILLLKDKNKNKYLLTATSFALYFLLTPVFNRTHFLWGFPFFLIALYRLTKIKKPMWTYVSWGGLYAAFFFYLLFWSKGLKPPSQEHPYVWMDNADSLELEWPLKQRSRQKFYEYRGKFYRWTNREEKL